MKQKSTMRIGRDGTKRWRLPNGKLHREDGPAIERSNGTKEWFINDKRHREDGPAIEWPDGTKDWYIDDKLHREDGPAVECADGYKEWYLDDKKYSQKEYEAMQCKASSIV